MGKNAQRRRATIGPNPPHVVCGRCLGVGPIILSNGKAFAGSHLVAIKLGNKTVYQHNSPMVCRAVDTVLKTRTVWQRLQYLFRPTVFRA